MLTTVRGPSQMFRQGWFRNTFKDVSNQIFVVVNLKGSALPADPKIWKNIKNVKMYFVENMLFLKVSGQMVSIAVFGVFFYIG